MSENGEKSARDTQRGTEMAANKQAVEKAAKNEVAGITPMAMLASAVEQGHDLEKIEKLMELESRWKADQAREAYYVALAEFKKVGVTVTKDKHNAQYNSKYTGIGNLVNTVSEAMAPFGLNARWEIDQTGGIKVTCILSHTLGHSESVPMSGPPDESGKKNPLQQIKSTVTYLESATFQAVTGVVSSDAADNDGNDAVEIITAEQAANLEALISEVGADRKKFKEYCNVVDLDRLPANKYQTAVRALERKRSQ